jgi:chorismate--pyruvate lyase
MVNLWRQALPANSVKKLRYSLSKRGNCYRASAFEAVAVTISANIGSYLAIVTEQTCLDNFPLGIDASWCLPTDLGEISVQMRDWLLDETSLTARLKRHCNDFAVRVLGESYHSLTLDERQMLATTEVDGFVREVLLLCDHSPWVFARTIVPRTTLLRGAALQNLGEQPLGALLFATPGMNRGKVEVTHLAADNPLCHRITAMGAGAADKGLWGRRSCFSLPAGPLLVNEIFLPDCIAYAGN